MSQLARPVGLGLAARGEVSEVVDWATEASDRGLDSVWVHDSYFERDAVTYTTAIASQVTDIRVALGALNPFTRHPVVLAMTVSAIDEMAPGRVILGLGTGLPLRLAQMDIAYSPDEAVARVEETIAMLHKLWAGERIVPATPNVPPLQPMFPPVHDVPIYIAAYRKDMVQLAGRIADGYMARPMESLPNFKRIRGILDESARGAGRDPKELSVQGYLMALTAPTRQEALNRAKREPFVIYMMSIHSEFTLAQAGFEVGLRDRIAAAWRAESYHQAAELIPDEMIDAFILCGTVEEVAARAWEFNEAGMDLPCLQPIVQEHDQTMAVIEAAARFGAASATAPSFAAEPSGPTENKESSRRSKIRGFIEVVRPFSLTASIVPVSAGGALAAATGHFAAIDFIVALLGAMLLQVGTNVINEIYDVREGIDSIVSPRASHAIVKGRVTEREAFALAATAFTLATIGGIWLIVSRGWPVVLLGILGLIGGFGYTAPPLAYKYKGLGVPFVFLLMGPLMCEGAYIVTAGHFSWSAIVLSIPIGLLVAAILHGNEWRDISEDARAGIRTLSITYGRRFAHYGYVALVIGAYITLAMGVMTGVLPTFSLLALLSLPYLVTIIRASELGAAGRARAIAMIDLKTARLHSVFGGLLVAGLIVAALN